MQDKDRVKKPSYIIYEGVKLGLGVVVGDFCIIGVPPRGHVVKELETVIGDGGQVRSHTVIYAGNRIGRNFQTGNKVNILELNTIGDNVSVGTLSVIEHHVDIGNDVRIHSQVFVPEFSTLEAECWLGPNVVLTNARYPVSLDAKKNLKGPVIRRRAKIGANVTILPGVVIGEDALVGAGSVVVRDVTAGAVVVGNPAKIIKNISDIPYYTRKD